MKNTLLNNLILLLISLLFVSASSCKKDDGLPKATQTGAGIMAAKVNGKVWSKTACWSCIAGGGGLSVGYGNNHFVITGQQKNDNTNIVISIGVIITAGKMSYTLNDNKTTNSATIYGVNANKDYYTTSPSSTGTITFTKIDLVNKIISGTFSFKAENENDPNDIITVTDGRFDVKYQTP